MAQVQMVLNLSLNSLLHQELAACDLEDLCATASLPEFPAALKRYVEVRSS